MRKLLQGLLFLFTLFVTSCDLIEYHPYDCNISGATGLTEKNIAKIEESCAGKDTVRFAVISDTQRWYDETVDIVNAINKRGDIDFVLHCGDQADFGLTKEFIWMRDIFLRFKMPFLCVIGNHDCLGTGEQAYHEIYGEDNFSFNASFIHFVCLNTNAFEYDYSVNIPDFSFLNADLNSLPSTVEKTIAVMHSYPTNEQFNNNVAIFFDETLKKYKGFQFCVHGHSHHNSVEEYLGDGVIYYQCGSAHVNAYLVFTITKDGMTYEAFGD